MSVLKFSKNDSFEVFQNVILEVFQKVSFEVFQNVIFEAFQNVSFEVSQNVSFYVYSVLCGPNILLSIVWPQLMACFKPFDSTS